MSQIRLNQPNRGSQRPVEQPVAPQLRRCNSWPLFKSHNDSSEETLSRLFQMQTTIDAQQARIDTQQTTISTLEGDLAAARRVSVEVTSATEPARIEGDSDSSEDEGARVAGLRLIEVERREEGSGALRPLNPLGDADLLLPSRAQERLTSRMQSYAGTIRAIDSIDNLLTTNVVPAVAFGLYALVHPAVPIVGMVWNGASFSGLIVLTYVELRLRRHYIQGNGESSNTPFSTRSDMLLRLSTASASSLFFVGSYGNYSVVTERGENTPLWAGLCILAGGTVFAFCIVHTAWQRYSDNRSNGSRVVPA